MGKTFSRIKVWVKMGHECWIENNQIVDTAPTRRDARHASVSLQAYITGHTITDVGGRQNL